MLIKLSEPFSNLIHSSVFSCLERIYRNTRPAQVAASIIVAHFNRIHHIAARYYNNFHRCLCQCLCQWILTCSLWCLRDLSIIHLNSPIYNNSLNKEFHSLINSRVASNQDLVNDLSIKRKTSLCLQINNKDKVLDILNNFNNNNNNNNRELLEFNNHNNHHNNNNKVLDNFINNNNSRDNKDLRFHLNNNNSNSR